MEENHAKKYLIAFGPILLIGGIIKRINHYGSRMQIKLIHGIIMVIISHTSIKT